MNVLILTILAVILYSLFAIFLARMGGKINESLGAAIFTGIAAFIPLAYYFYQKLADRASEVVTTPRGITYAVLAGVAIAAWNVIVIVIFARGGNLSYVYPVIYGLGAIAIPTLAGWLLFKEVITLTQGLGVALIVVGAGLVVLSKV